MRTAFARAASADLAEPVPDLVGSGADEHGLVGGEELDDRTHPIDGEGVIRAQPALNRQVWSERRSTLR